MAGALVSDYGIADVNLDNVMLTLDKTYKGNMSMSLTEMDSTTVPAIAAGSWAEDNGALYKFDTETAISTTDPVTTAAVANGVIFACLIPSGATMTAAFTATEPTWSDSKQGFYGTGGQSNYKYIARCYKYYDGYSTTYTAKQLLNNETYEYRYNKPIKEYESIDFEQSSWQDVTWSPSLSLFCAVSLNGTDQVMTSPDGIIWTARSASASKQWRSICWSEELTLFCAVSINSAVMTSPDGITWTTRTPSSATAAYRSICWSPSLALFCVVGDDGSGNPYIMTSPDGITWTSRTPSGSTGFLDVCWSEELTLFCAVGGTSSTAAGTIDTSPDGINWTNRSTQSGNFATVIYDIKNGLFIAIASFYDGVTYSFMRIGNSSDGASWSFYDNYGGIGTSLCLSHIKEYEKTFFSDGAYIFASSYDGKNFYYGFGNKASKNPGGSCWSPELKKYCGISGNVNIPYGRIKIIEFP